MRTLKLKIQEIQQASSSINPKGNTASLQFNKPKGKYTKSYQNQTAQNWSKESTLSNAGGGVGCETTDMQRLKDKTTDLFLKTIQAEDNGAMS